MNQPKQIPHSEATANPTATVFHSDGSVGIGYLANGSLYRTTGSYWAVLIDDAVHYDEDGGRGYMAAIRRAIG